MVQLIKINNKQDSGFFTNQFSEIITFPEDAQIALVSSTFSMGLNNIMIDSTNNTLDYSRVNAEVLPQVSLELGNYTQTSLMAEMRQKINSAQTAFKSAGIRYGFDINPTVNDTTGKFVLSFEKTDYTLSDDTNCEDLGLLYDAPTKTWTANTPDSSVGAYNKWAFPKLKFNNGSGTARCIISGRGFFGLVTEFPTEDDIITSAGLAYGLIADDSKYYSVINGVKTDLLIASNYAFLLQIELASGKLTFSRKNVIDPLNPFVTLFEVDYDYNTAGYYIGAGLEQRYDTITDYGVNLQSFAIPNTTEDYVEYNDQQVVEKVQLGAMKATIFQIDYAPELAELLGYTTDSFRVGAISKSFPAIFPFVDSSLGESIDIQLINIGNVKSFDSVSGKSQRIVAVIPIGSELSANKLVYSAPELLYIDLNNKFDIPVSSLTFKIVGSETGNQLIFENGITMTFAVRGQKELMYK